MRTRSFHDQRHVHICSATKYAVDDKTLRPLARDVLTVVVARGMCTYGGPPQIYALLRSRMRYAATVNCSRIINGVHELLK